MRRGGGKWLREEGGHHIVTVGRMYRIKCVGLAHFGVQEMKNASGNDTPGEACNQPFSELISFSSFFVAGFDELAKKYMLHIQ